MHSDKQIGEPRKRGFFRKLLKWSAISLAVVATGATIAHFVWKSSGSGEPKLVIEKDGIRIYTIKQPGDPLLKVMAKRRLDTTMDRAVSGMIDDTLENCADWNPRCFGSEVVKKWDPETLSYVQLWRQHTPIDGLTPREFLLDVKVTQNAADKSATVQFQERPDLIPPNDCCVRVEHMRSRWTFTPVDADTIDVELVVDVDTGLPYPLFNWKGPEGVYFTLEDLPRLFNAERYNGAKLDWLLVHKAAEVPAAADAPAAAAESSAPAPAL
jgi:hypothetical protein